MQLKKMVGEENDDDTPKQLANVCTEGSNAPVSKPTLMLEFNNHPVSLSNYTDTNYESECEVKQGYLALVKDIDSSNGPVVKAVPVFTVLNDKTIAFFENENLMSLLKSVDLDKLAVPVKPDDLSDLNCF